MSGTSKERQKKETLKGIIKRLHKGEDPDIVKEEFKEFLKDVTPVEISKIEEELIKDGMPSEEVHGLCDVHLAIFREKLDREELEAPPGHPIRILMEEHKSLLDYANELVIIGKDLAGSGDFDSIADEVKHLDHIGDHLKDSESHYVREENVLFPYLEKHGITEPPAMMWIEHDKIREIKKGFYTILETREAVGYDEFRERLREVGAALADALSSHFFKENNILFPAAMQVIDDGEWTDARKQFDELGYCCFTPETGEMAVEVTEETKIAPAGLIDFETGQLSKEQLEAVLNTLPFDITFVDDSDKVRYFNESARIFPRTKAIIGREVQKCHPEKSVHLVNQIVEEFRAGTRDVADFWIECNGRMTYIRYFPVRDPEGKYLGCLEVTQDIEDIKKIEGSKRLL